MARASSADQAESARNRLAIKFSFESRARVRLRPSPHGVKRSHNDVTLKRGIEVMADTKHAPYGGYSPDMDARSHEATYHGFLRFAEIGTVVVMCHVLALAVGGVRHAWLTAIFGVILLARRGRCRRHGAVGRRHGSGGCGRPAAAGARLLLSSTGALDGIPTELDSIRAIDRIAGGPQCGSPFSPKPMERRRGSPPPLKPSRNTKALGADVVVQAGAGAQAGIPDAEFEAAGASIAAGAPMRPQGCRYRPQGPPPREGELDGRQARRRWSSPSWTPMARTRPSRPGRCAGRRLRHGADAPHHPRPGDGRALLPGQSRRLPRRHRRLGRIRPGACR